MSEAESIARALKGRKSGNGWSCPCPSLTHGGKDKTPSLSVSEGNDGKLLLRCHKGCTFDDVMAALRSRGLIEEKRRSYARSAEEIIANMAARTARPAPRTYSTEETFMKVEAQVEPLQRGRAWDPLEYERSHIYHDASGNPCRLVAVKRKPDGDKQVVQFGRLADGSWDTAAPKGPAVPYRLPALLAAQGMSPVFIPEGEKDVETLEALGHLATTNPGGAASWHEDLNQFFKGLEVLIVPDADKAGEDRIGKLCDHLAGVAASIKIVRLPGPEFRENHGEDITDWIKRHGHTNEEFIELARNAPEWESPSAIGELPPLTLSEWSERELPPPDFVMGYWLTTTTRCLLTAATGLGKSNLALALGMRAAAGASFLHWRERRCVRVLYIDGEMSRRLLKERLAYEATRLGIAPETFHALSREDVENFPPLNTPEGQQWLYAFIKKIGGIDLIIFDNIMSLTLGDQKDPLVWQQTLPFALELTRRAIGQIWIHHAGHDATKGYGDKSREWQMDTVIHLDAVKRDDTDVSFQLSFKKARERTPATRDDFQDVKIALVDDCWERNIAGPLQQGKVSPQTRKALDALTNVLAGDQVTKLSGNRRAAHRDHWQAECALLGLIDQAKADSARALFSKFRRELVAAHFIACEGDMSWRI
jgi:AAA domain